MRNICAWCGAEKDDSPLWSDPVSHGICPPCYEKQLRVLSQLPNRTILSGRGSGPLPSCDSIATGPCASPRTPRPDSLPPDGIHDSDRAGLHGATVALVGLILTALLMAGYYLMGGMQ